MCKTPPVRAGLAPSSGTTVGPFQLVSRLGGGEDTDVWRADGDGIIVAVKVLRDPTDLLAVARMAREAAALRRVAHPHVITVFDVGDEHGEPYLATPLLDGGTLGALLDDGLLLPEIACATLAPIADALAACHSAGIVHRDLKPSNIICSDDGPLLIDFGAAAIDGVTLDGWVAGAAAAMLTPKYAAPDETPTPASDVYSLGVVLAESVGWGNDMGAAADGIGSLIDACVHDDPTKRPVMIAVAERLHALARGSSAALSAAPLDLLDDIAGTLTHVPSAPNAAFRTGRELELARLVDEFDASLAASEMRATLMVAPAGAGKSWLFDAAAERVVAHDAFVLRASCSEAVGDVRALAGWVRRVGSAARIAELVGDHHASVLLHSVGLISGPTSNADAAAISEALASMLSSCGRPVAMIDDLHHASPDLIDVLARLSFRRGVAGVLWMSARPGQLDPDDLEVQTIALGPLDDEVIINLAGAEAAELAGGNPLLARELAHAQAAGAELGDDVQAMIGARLDRLDPDVRRDLAIVAACGEVFWPETLHATRSLGSLCRAGVVRVRVASAVSGSTEAQWTHPLLREVAYARLDAVVRRNAHLDVARKLDAVAIDVELVAHHAAIAFETGADAAEFVANVAARAGRVALDRFALANADRWTTLLDAIGVEPAAGTADTLRAELLLRRGEYVESAQLADSWIDQDSDVGTRALALSAEAHLATGELELAVDAGGRAIERLPDSLFRDLVAGRHATALSRIGNYPGAIEAANAAMVSSLGRGQRQVAAQLKARVEILNTEFATMEGRDSLPHITEAQNALRQLREFGDRRAIAEAAFDLAESVSVVDAEETVQLLELGLAEAERLGDAPLTAKLAFYAGAMALEVGDAARLHSMLKLAELSIEDYRHRFELATLRDVVFLAEHGPDVSTMADLDRIAVECGHWVPQAALAGVVVPLWFGRSAEARIALSHKPVNPVAEFMARSALKCFDGPSGWGNVSATDLPSNSVGNELALVAYLRGDLELGDQLLADRHEYLISTGSTYQRYNQYFSGALVAALGPPATQPRVDWLVAQILEPEFPMMWAVHRAICAMLLSERGHPDGRALHRGARRLLQRAQPDPVVMQWMTLRLDAAQSLY